MAQEHLWCACGSTSVLNRHGRCARCDRRRRLSLEHFGGLRAEAIERDGCCRACGEVEGRRLLVHHRKPGVNSLRWFVTLCRSCHPRIHHSYSLPWAASGLLRELWREQNRGMAEQLLLIPAADDAVQPGLF
jgi:hypothetical protein